MQVTYRGCLALCAWACLCVPAEAWQMAPPNGSHVIILAFMAARRCRGSDGIYFDHAGPCTEPARHRHCPGRWRGVISLGSGPDGKRIRRKVSGTTKAIVADRLAQLHRDLDADPRPAPANHTVRQAAEDWLEHGLCPAGPPRPPATTRTRSSRSWPPPAPSGSRS
jgi:hypothetical protein